MGKALNLGSAFLLALSVACAGDEGSNRPPIGELEQGINVLDASDSSWGMAAAYVEGDRVIYIETRVGALKPSVYREAYPDDPDNEMDLLMADRDGAVFFSMRGGDTYIDPSWEQQIARSLATPEIDMAGRDADFRLAQKAAIALGGVLPIGFRDHALHMAGFAKMTPPADSAEMQARAAELAASPPEIGYGNYSNGDWNVYETDLYSADAGCFAWICAAKHSATYMWAYKWNNGAPGWVVAQTACNHGRCPWNLGYNCYTQGGWVWNTTINGETNSNSTSVSGGCLTPYNWNSGGYDHLCNSDAAYELWQAKSGSKSTSQGDGYSFVWYNTGEFACNCNNTGCDNDYNRPNCP